MKPSAKDRLRVRVASGRTLVISIGIETLAHAIRLAPSLETFDEASGEFRGPRVTDPKVFAEEVVRALVHEDAEGTTRVHRMLDAAALAAFEDGAEGIEIPDAKEKPRD